jgi:coatomer subunit beta'
MSAVYMKYLYAIVFHLTFCNNTTLFFYLQRDVVSSHLDGGGSVGEEGVEDAFELLHEINERIRTGLWVGDCFIYNNSQSRLNYCVGGEVSFLS